MKERLTGAIIVVALLVLLVPELLTGPGPSAPRQSTAEDGGPLRSYTIDLAEDAAAARTASIASPAPTPVTEEPVASATADSSADAAGTAATEIAEITRGSGEPARAGGAVEPAPPSQGGSASGAGGVTASTSASAPAVRKSETAPASTPKAEPSKAGPPKPEPARVERREPAQVASTSKPAPRPAESAPASARASTSTGWMVQLGVFAQRENADRLAKQVRGKGYPVVVQETSGNGRRLWRVRVGPEPDRDAATALASRLRAAGHAGSLVAPN